MRQEFRDVRMDRMLEERDHLKIRINIMENDPDARPAPCAEARKDLEELEHEIAHHRPYSG